MLSGSKGGKRAVRQLPYLLEEARPPTRRVWDVSAAADLLVSVMGILPGEIREWLKAKHNLVRNIAEGLGASGSAPENP